MCNAHHSWDVAAQVEQRVELDGAFFLAELGPGKKREAQIDGGRIERVNSLLQGHTETVAEIKFSGLGDQHLREVGVDAPVSHRVGVGQSVARHSTTDAHVIELRLLRSEAGFDVAQALAIS